MQANSLTPPASAQPNPNARAIGLLLPVVITVCGLMVASSWLHSDELACRRVAASPPLRCTVLRTTFWFIQDGPQLVQGPERARIVEKCAEGCIYDLILDATGGEVHLATSDVLALPDRQAAVARINQFLADSQIESLDVTLDKSTEFHQAAPCIFIGLLWLFSLFIVRRSKDREWHAVPWNDVPR